MPENSNQPISPDGPAEKEVTTNKLIFQCVESQEFTLEHGNLFVSTYKKTSETSEASNFFLEDWESWTGVAPVEGVDLELRISDNHDLSLTLSFDQQNRLIHARNYGREILPEDYDVVASDLRSLSQGCLEMLEQPARSLLESFLRDNRTPLADQRSLSVLGITVEADAPWHHDTTKQTMVETKVVGEGQIVMGPVQGELKSLAIEKGTPKCFSAMYIFDEAELFVSGKSPYYHAEIDGVAENGIMQAAVGMSDLPRSAVMADEFVVKSLKECNLLIQVPKPRSDTTFVRDSSPDSAEQFVRQSLDLVPLVLLLAPGKENEQIKVVLQSQEDTIYDIHTIPTLTISELSGAVLGVGVRMTEESSCKQVKLEINNAGEIRHLASLRYGHNKNGFIEIRGELRTANRGVRDIIVKRQTELERWRVKYQLGTSESKLDLVRPDGATIEITFSGEKGNNGRVMLLESNGAYCQHDMTYLLGKEVGTEVINALWNELSSVGNVCHRMQALFHQFLDDRSDFTTQLRTMDLQGEPLEKWRWEQIFGPDPDGIIADPRDGVEIPGEELGVRRMRGRPRGRTRKATSDLGYSIEPESFKILQQLNFRVASERYVEALFSAKTEGFVCSHPHRSGTEYLSVYVRSDGELGIAGMAWMGSGTYYSVKLNLPKWELQGVASIDGRVSEWPIFVLPNPLEQVLPASIIKRDSNNEELEEEVGEIADFSWNESTTKLQRLLAKFYQPCGELYIRKSGLSMGGTINSDHLITDARDKIAYMPGNWQELRNVLRD